MPRHERNGRSACRCFGRWALSHGASPYAYGSVWINRVFSTAYSDRRGFDRAKEVLRLHVPYIIVRMRTKSCQAHAPHLLRLRLRPGPGRRRFSPLAPRAAPDQKHHDNTADSVGPKASIASPLPFFVDDKQSNKASSPVPFMAVNVAVPQPRDAAGICQWVSPTYFPGSGLCGSVRGFTGQEPSFPNATRCEWSETCRQQNRLWHRPPILSGRGGRCGGRARGPAGPGSRPVPSGTVAPPEAVAGVGHDGPDAGTATPL